MGYKHVKNIVAINIFTNILLNILILIENEKPLDISYIIATLAILELTFIPLSESWFYSATDTDQLSKRRIKVHTYIANFLSYMNWARSIPSRIPDQRYSQARSLLVAVPLDYVWGNCINMSVIMCTGC